MYPTKEAGRMVENFIEANRMFSYPLSRGQVNVLTNWKRQNGERCGSPRGKN